MEVYVCVGGREGEQWKCMCVGGREGEQWKCMCV